MDWMGFIGVLVEVRVGEGEGEGRGLRHARVDGWR